MSKQPSRGHISVKGETYWAFKAVCEAANSKMGAVLDDLISETLDGDLTEETAYWAKLHEEKLEAIKTRSHDYQRKARARKIEKCKPGELLITETILERGDFPPPEGIKPEKFLAGFYHRFGMPGPVASILPNEVEPTPQGKPGSVFLIPDKDETYDPYHVEVSRKLLRAQVMLKPPPALFSEEGLKMAEAAPKNDPVATPTPGRLARASITNADDIPSCIDPTFGKK